MERQYESEMNDPIQIRSIDRSSLSKRLMREGHNCGERLAIYCTLASTSLAPLLLKYSIPDQIGHSHPGEIAKWGMAAAVSYLAYPFTAAIGRDIGKKIVKVFRGHQESNSVV
jgi:hypothetical protein